MDWWEEDPELLSVTLSMLIDGGDDGTAEALGSESSNDAHDTDLMGVSRRKAARHGPRAINLSRERRREETRQLRQTVADLEGELDALKLRREEMLQAHKGDGGEIRSIAVVWENVATRQFRERRRAEMMNTRLRVMLEAQHRVTADLVDAIRRAEALNHSHEAETRGYLSTTTRLRLPANIHRKVSDEEQLRRLELLCIQWEEAFTRSSKLNDGKSMRLLDIELLADDGVDAVVDVFVSWALPFPRPLVEEKMWRYFLDDYTESDDHSWLQAIESRNHTHSGVFNAVSLVDGHRVSFDGKLVAKHFRNPKGHLILTVQTHTEPHCASNLLEDVVVEEDSWVRIADAHDLGGPHLACPLVLVQHVRRFHIRFNASLNRYRTVTQQAQTRRVGALTQFLMQQTKNEMIKGEQIVENLLLNSNSREPLIISK